MDPTPMSPRTSEVDDDTFLQIFLSPLQKKKSPRRDGEDFKNSWKRQELERKPSNPNTCLSRTVLKQLQDQQDTLKIDKEKRVRKRKVELYRESRVSNVDSQVTDRKLQGQAHCSNTTESHAESMESGLSTEEASGHEETVIISNDEKALEDITKQTERLKLGETAEVEKEEGKENAEQLNKEQKADVEKMLRLAREIKNIEEEQSHLQLSASKWTMKILQIYIKRDNVDFVETLVPGRDAASGLGKRNNDRFSSLKNDLVMRSRQLLPDHQHFSLADEGLKLHVWSLQFAKPMLKEQSITFMVLEIIGAVCDLCDVRMKPEETLPQNEFPGSRVDYALVYEGVIIGIVEVKTPTTMNKDALAQLKISLLKLQHSHNDARMQHIGILTDGFRFVLISLQGDKFTIEKTMNMEIPEIKVHIADTWTNLFKLCEYLQSVLISVTDNLGEIFWQDILSQLD